MQPTRTSVVTAGNFTIGALEITSANSDAPLLVCLPGGSYTADYFDVDGHSLLRRAAAEGFDAIALDRPNYGTSDTLPHEETTYERNAEIIDDAVAQVWSRRAGSHPGVVLVGHSIGGAVAIHMAANHLRRWPLLGISISAINELSPPPVVDAWKSIPGTAPVDFTAEQRRIYMYGPDDTFAPEVLTHAAASEAPMPLAELKEVVGGWLEDIGRLGPTVRVPVQYALPEFDQLWEVSQDRVDTFAGRFVNSTLVDAYLVRGVGHNLDHHQGSDAWHDRVLSFARRCAALTGATTHLTSKTVS
jgi:pimeloyl-ACP methyl ester carboxylesterase